MARTQPPGELPERPLRENDSAHPDWVRKSRRGRKTRPNHERLFGERGRPDRTRRPTRKRRPNNLFCFPADGIPRPKPGHFLGESSNLSLMIRETHAFLYLRSQLRVVYFNCAARTRLFIDIRAWRQWPGIGGRSPVPVLISCDSGAFLRRCIKSFVSR
jgi:hypothetical protein